MIFFRFSDKSGFGVFFVQQNMVETTLPDGLDNSGRRADSDNEWRYDDISAGISQDLVLKSPKQAKNRREIARIVLARRRVYR